MQTTRPVVLYIATSLDGYIADDRGGIDWLTEIAGDGDYGYVDFLATVDAIVMGRTTYDQVLTFGDWPYFGKKCYVFTSRKAAPDPNVELVKGDVTAFVRRLRTTVSGSIWLVGGAGLADAFFKAKLVDKLVITVVPLLLGSGIPLFRNGSPRTPLRLMEARQYDELVQLHYVTK